MILSSNETLENFYIVNFDMVYEHKLTTFTELDNMLPFEREIYMHLLNERIEEKNKKTKQKQGMQ